MPERWRPDDGRELAHEETRDHVAVVEATLEEATRLAEEIEAKRDDSGQDRRYRW